MSTEFYRVSDSDKLLWIAALRPGMGLWAWVPNTNSWHHHRDMEVDFGANGSLKYEQISELEAAQLRTRIPMINEDGVNSWVIEELRAQPESERATDSEVGLTVSSREEIPADSSVAPLEVDAVPWLVVSLVRGDDAVAKNRARHLARLLSRAPETILASNASLTVRMVNFSNHGLVVLARRKEPHLHADSNLAYFAAATAMAEVGEFASVSSALSFLTRTKAKRQAASWRGKQDPFKRRRLHALEKTSIPKDSALSRGPLLRVIYVDPFRKAEATKFAGPDRIVDILGPGASHGEQIVVYVEEGSRNLSLGRVRGQNHVQ